MSRPFLIVTRLERRLPTEHIEHLDFREGVNLLVGRPNTGKTKWLQTLDFLLDDPGENPSQVPKTLDLLKNTRPRPPTS